jgi:PmbA protein
MAEDYQALCERMVALALARGADDAEVVVTAGREFTAAVREGEIDKLIEATSQTLGLRVYRQGRAGATYTSDLSPDALEAFVDRSLDLTNVSDADEHRRVPELDERPPFPDLALYDPAIEALTAEEQIDFARRCEQAMHAVDPRLLPGDGAEFSSEVSTYAFANSRGFAGSYRSSLAALQVEAVVEDADQKKRNDYWVTMERSLVALETPEEVGRKAAERAVRKLGPRKVATRAVPVVWDKRMARALLGRLAQAVSGEALYRKATFLAGCEGEHIASSLVTIVDDPLLPGRAGSRPFDAEGVPTRRNVIIEQGVFRQFLFDTYNANRTGRRSTGNARGGVGAMPGIGVSNLILEPGPHTDEEILASVEDGLYLTELMGFGTNITTGDFSQGAAGFWIERGQITYPVSEINVAGNLREMLAGIEMVGDDLEFRGATAAPTIKMRRLMVSGL